MPTRVDDSRRQGANLFLLIRCKHRNLLIRNVRPLHKLALPLHHRHTLTRVSTTQRSLETKVVAHPEVARTNVLFLIVHAAVIPTSVLPAPQGNTMIPDRARLGSQVRQEVLGYIGLVTYPLPNILLRLFSWYGRITVMGLRSMSRLALM